MEYRIPSSDNWPSGHVDRILHGNSLDRLRELPDECVGLAVTSPPYWNVVDYGIDGQIGQSSYEQYIEDMIAVWRETTRVLIPNGKLAVVTPVMPIPKAQISDQHTRHLKNIAADIEASILHHIPDLYRFSLFVWKKQTTTKMFGSYPFPPNIYEDNTIEFINVYVKAGPPPRIPKEAKEPSRLSQAEWLNLSKQIWPIYPQDVKRAGGHPAPFPVVLPQRLIMMYTFGANPWAGFAGDIVLDMFNGSGATTLAAKSTGRRWIGIDLHPGYCEYAESRLRDERVGSHNIIIDEDRVRGAVDSRQLDLFPAERLQPEMFADVSAESTSETVQAD